MRRSAAALSTAVSATLLSAFWAAAPAQAATTGAADTVTATVTLDPTGTVDANGFVTVSGTYRCSPLPTGVAVVASTLGMYTGATCDGAEHTFTDRRRPAREQLYTVGPTEVGASVTWMRNGSYPVIIQATKIASDTRTVYLQAPAN
ncbi:DUF6299 family protein [Kitasatospora cineracea]|uniref:DUF6299 domain-containing protein n=1 Tax=Kitasatospora cineracea TaxID=88074 RepID=A0A3N4S0G1_9ACTN|nr:DUF6299 family protein [Kitasatospora cineracea]RPE36425.1 hypothetical protein EDD38_4798 [Kitasatospora cineracea]